MLWRTPNAIRGQGMDRWVGIAILIITGLIAAPALAQQGPMSPIFRATAGDQVQPPASKAIAVAPVPAATKPAPAVAKTERDDHVIATAVIPPPLPAAPPAAASPNQIVKRQKRPPAQAQPEEAAAQPAAAKTQKRAAAPKRYARRHHA